MWFLQVLINFRTIKLLSFAVSRGMVWPGGGETPGYLGNHTRLIGYVYIWMCVRIYALNGFSLPTSLYIRNPICASMYVISLKIACQFDFGEK